MQIHHKGKLNQKKVVDTFETREKSGLGICNGGDKDVANLILIDREGGGSYIHWGLACGRHNRQLQLFVISSK